MKPKAIGLGTVRHNGYFVEVTPGGPWLTKDYEITTRFGERGIWQTMIEAQEAVRKSLSPKSGSKTP